MFFADKKSDGSNKVIKSKKSPTDTVDVRIKLPEVKEGESIEELIDPSLSDAAAIKNHNLSSDLFKKSVFS